ncbi:hypothetical protein GCM10029992_01210 [Glycomyces albus]
MAEIEIDPTALEEYRTVVREQLDYLETIIPRLEKGKALGRMPAFGRLDSAEAARTNYQTFHETTWNNLQDLRQSLDGMITGLNDSAELAEENDENSASEIGAYDDGLNGD